ncbi:SDR family oxidoreductase [Nonomuraea sp. NPDC003804]|uniref:SDR family oxidoreductase n=1 Tax=Nonomuraea sp. NPDC003804 TaxID=3154547 RepID=UPI0033AE6987
MNIGLAGKRAVVLAGTRGLGWGAAAALAREGCDVVVCGRSVTSSSSAHPAITALPCDLRDVDQLDAFLSTAIAMLGGVDVLVTNCGGPKPGAAAEGALTDDDWVEAFQSVLLSVIRSCRRVIPLMRAQRGGAVICVGSTSAIQPIQGLALSNALRPALLGFARTLAEEVAADGVRVNCVLPGPSATERSLEISSWEAAATCGDAASVLRRRTQATPLGRLGAPEELGRLVAFLAGETGSFCTGTAAVMDGGFSLRPVRLAHDEQERHAGSH